MTLESLDLHGYTVKDAILAMVRRCNRIVAQGQGRELRGIEVIHGKGKGDTPGAIRDTLREYLRDHGSRITGWDAKLTMRGAPDAVERSGRLAYIHGEDVDGNGGKTVLFPRQPLSSPYSWLKYR